MHDEALCAQLHATFPGCLPMTLRRRGVSTADACLNHHRCSHPTAHGTRALPPSGISSLQTTPGVSKGGTTGDTTRSQFYQHKQQSASSGTAAITCYIVTSQISSIRATATFACSCPALQRALQHTATDDNGQEWHPAAKASPSLCRTKALLP